MKNAKVIIVDDESIVRKGLHEWLSNKYETVCFNSGETFLKAFNNYEFEDGKPTCILLDFQMPGMNGVELQSAIRSMNVEFPIIFMSGNALQTDIINAWRGGAVDFILKPFDSKQVSEILDAQFNQLKKINLKNTPKEVNEIEKLPITKREAEVLLLLGKGLRQPEIAKTLGLSLRTVKMYRTFLRNKLDLNTLIEIARYCDRHKLSILNIVNK